MRRKFLLLGALAALAAAVASLLLWPGDSTPTIQAGGAIEAVDSTDNLEPNKDEDIVLRSDLHPCTDPDGTANDIDFQIVDGPTDGTLTVDGTDLDDDIEVPEDDDSCSGDDDGRAVVIYNAGSDSDDDEFTYVACHDDDSNGCDDETGVDRSEPATVTLIVGEPDGGATPTPTGTPPAEAEEKFEVNASSDLTLTTTLTKVPGLGIILAEDNWKIEVCVLFSEQGSGDEGQTAAFALYVDGSKQNGAGVVRLYDSQFQTTCFNWLIDPDEGDVVEVRAKKSAGTGTSKVLSGNETSRMIGTIEP